MAHARVIEASLLQVGAEVFPVFGNDADGWSMTANDLEAAARVPKGALYASLEELFFALVNMNTCAEGRA